MTEIDVALEAARASAKLLAERKDLPRHVSHKGEKDLVTDTDEACERAIREVLARHTPDIPVLGEEQGGAVDARTRWVVDPLDGTINFVHGFPWYCVSIALEVDGERFVGVIVDPIRGLTWQAQRGRGAFQDGQRLSVSPCRELANALIGTGFPYDRKQRGRFYLERVALFLEACIGIRRAGAAALDFTMVASGQLDGFWEYGLKRWDVAAGALLVEEAGGKVTHLTGTPLEGLVQDCVASNGWLHDAMLETLNRVG